MPKKNRCQSTASRETQTAALALECVCGLAKARSRKGEGPDEPYSAELTPEKEAAICTAFIRFGMIAK